MAINPATIKLISRLTVSILTDEDKRRNLIISIVVGIVIFLMIILIPLFILLSPLEAIKLYFSADKNGNITDSSYISMVNIKNSYESKNLETGELTFNGGILPMPVQNPTVTCEFGSRIHPITKKQSYHTGIDLAGKWHSNIMCVKDGIVVFAGVQRAYGNCVEIEHKDEKGNTFFSFYAHLARIDVVREQNVVQGNIIGIQGGDPKRDPNPRLQYRKSFAF